MPTVASLARIGHSLTKAIYTSHRPPLRGMAAEAAKEYPAPTHEKSWNGCQGLQEASNAGHTELLRSDAMDGSAIVTAHWEVRETVSCQIRLINHNVQSRSWRETVRHRVQQTAGRKRHRAWPLEWSPLLHLPSFRERFQKHEERRRINGWYAQL